MKPRDIVRLRERIGVTQAELAKRLGVGTITVRFWEAGRRPITPRTAGQLEQIRVAADMDALERDDIRSLGATPSNTRMGRPPKPDALRAPLPGLREREDVVDAVHRKALAEQKSVPDVIREILRAYFRVA